MSGGGKRRKDGLEAAAIMALAGPDGLIAVRVTPNAKADGLEIEEGPEGPRLRLRVTAVPEDGKANRAVIKLLARALGRPKSALSIERGETSRDKTIRIAGG